MKCSIYGDPKPVFTWYFTRKSDDTKHILNNNLQQLTISDMRVKPNVGYYGCNATNRAGNTSLRQTFVDIDGRYTAYRKETLNGYIIMFISSY